MNIHNEYVKGQSSCMFILVPACTDIATITCMFICMYMWCNKVSVDYIYMQMILILAIAIEMVKVNLIDNRNLLVGIQSTCILFCKHISVLLLYIDHDQLCIRRWPTDGFVECLTVLLEYMIQMLGHR